MVRLLSLVFISLFALSVQAADFGIEAGVRSQSGDSPTSGLTVQSRTNFQLGGVGQFTVSGPFELRTGLMYVQRSVDLKVSGATNTGLLTLTYFDIPVLASYKFEDYGSVFAGPVLSFILDKKCDFGNGAACDTSKAKSMVIPIQIGATFKFMPQMGATIFYETIPADLMTDVYTSSRAIGVNFLVTFD